MIEETIGARIVQAREQTDLTTAQLARRLGVQSKTMAAWENGNSEPRSNRLVNLAGVLNVSALWLLTGQTGQPAHMDPDQELNQIRVQVEDVQAQLVRLSETMGTLVQRISDFENR
ncbi:MAG: helix-turn-helix domain-containing protein [Rhodospirillaceae bacterium]|nr:helix-turn-helix domain-containing protein [Rhodospirillaceae bacterium]